MVGLLRSSPGTGTAIVVPLGLTLLAAAFPAGGGAASLASGAASRASVAAGPLVGWRLRGRACLVIAA
jgi:hypothetical protein